MAAIASPQQNRFSFGLWSVVLAAAAMPAQERRPAFVTVVDREGAAAAAAKVTAFAAPRLGEFGGALDVVEAMTDARGRAVVKLLDERCYSAFAVTAPAGDGTFASSDVGEDLLGAGELGLRLGLGRRPQQLALRGAEAWADAAPLQLQVGPFARNALLLPAAPGALPPLPPVACVRVLDRSGAPLWSVAMPFDPQSRSVSAALEVVLPPPQSLTVRVVDPAGAPQPGVELWQGLEQGFGPRSGSPGTADPFAARTWRRVGTSGTDGTPSLRMAAEVGDGKVKTTLLVQARAPGRTLGEGGVMAFGPPFQRHQTIPVPADQVVPIPIEPAQALQVVPPQACDLLVVGAFLMPLSMPGTTEGPLALQAGADGKASLPLPRDPLVVRAALVTRRGSAPTWALLVQGAQGCEVRPGARTVHLRVRDARGDPARGAVAMIVPWSRPTLGPLNLPLPLGRRGESTVGVGPGVWVIWVRCGDGVAWHLVAADDAGGEADLVPAPPAAATLRARDRDGKPLAGVRLQLSLSLQWQSRNASLLDSFLAFRTADLWPQPSLSTVTDAEGQVRIPLLPLPGALVCVEYCASDPRVTVIRRRCTLGPGETHDIVTQ